MKKTSLQIDQKTRAALDQYCLETGQQLSEAIRSFIKEGIANFEKEKAHGFKDSIGPNGLMINQKYAIRAAIEGTLLLRKIAQKAFQNEKELQAALADIDENATKIIKSGWHYDNK